MFCIVKVPVNVKTEDDVITCASSLTTSNIIPIFTVSCVTGEGLDLLPPSMNIRDRERLIQSDSEFQVCFQLKGINSLTFILLSKVDETFQVPEVGKKLLLIFITLFMIHIKPFKLYFNKKYKARYVLNCLSI